MPLNRKRRIFRPAAAPSRRPAPGLLLVVAGGVLGSGVAAWLWARPAPAPSPVLRQLSAEARQAAVVDGETIRIDVEVLRLDGISAPGRGELCAGTDGTTFDCGAAAATALAARLRDGTLHCAVRGQDEQGRPRAACTVGGTDLGHALVTDGWARATGPDAALRAAETAARAARRGLWAAEATGR